MTTNKKSSAQSGKASSKGIRLALRVLAVALLIGLTLAWAEPQKVWLRLSSLRADWILAGVLLSVPTYLLLAWRWYFVAKRIGAPIGYWRSLREYYLGSFANQTLPTGLAGAALRALRHARSQTGQGGLVGYGPAIAGVVLERISGLAGLCLFVLASSLLLSLEGGLLALWAIATVLLVAVAASLAFWLAATRISAAQISFRTHARNALLRDGALAFHALVSTSCVALLVLGYYCAAQASDVQLGLGRAFVVAPLVLGAMVVPLALAGWGIREAASALLFSAMGMEPAVGVAVAISFGGITLISSAPGLLVFLASLAARKSHALTQNRPPS